MYSWNAEIWDEFGLNSFWIYYFRLHLGGGGVGNDWQEIPRCEGREAKQHLSRGKDKSSLGEIFLFCLKNWNLLFLPAVSWIAALEDPLEWHMSVFCGWYYVILTKQAFASINLNDSSLTSCMNDTTPTKKCHFLRVFLSLTVKMEKKIGKESQETQSWDFIFFFGGFYIKIGE